MKMNIFINILLQFIGGFLILLFYGFNWANLIGLLIGLAIGNLIAYLITYIQRKESDANTL
jgi:NhaP-type Na+/H+ or K+/H+ antiporter